MFEIKTKRNDKTKEVYRMPKSNHSWSPELEIERGVTPQGARNGFMPS